MTENTGSVSVLVATGELIKGATLVVEVASQKKDLLSLDARINTVNQNICHMKDQVTLAVEASSQSMKESLDAKINKNICQLKDQVTKVNTSIEHQTKALESQTKVLERQTRVQSLEWAIQNIDLFDDHSFEYCVSGYRRNIKTDARCIHLSFRQGLGHYIEDSEDALEESKKTYRVKMANYIYLMTGVMPRLQLENNGKYAIYYS